MPTYIALLRGINVSGKKKIPMADLRMHLAELKYENIQTYIQSGNVIFDSKKTDPKKLAKQIKNLILEKFGFEVNTIIKTHSDLLKYKKKHPFDSGKESEIKFLYYVILSEPAEKEKVKALQDFVYKEDQFKITDEVVYVYVPGGYGRTKLNNNFFESKLKISATTRNWKTITKLIELSDR